MRSRDEVRGMLAVRDGRRLDGRVGGAAGKSLPSQIVPGFGSRSMSGSVQYVQKNRLGY